MVIHSPRKQPKRFSASGSGFPHASITARLAINRLSTWIVGRIHAHTFSLPPSRSPPSASPARSTLRRPFRSPEIRPHPSSSSPPPLPSRLLSLILLPNPAPIPTNPTRNPLSSTITGGGSWAPNRASCCCSGGSSSSSGRSVWIWSSRLDSI